MAPKKKGEAKQEPLQGLPRLGDRDVVKLHPVFDAAEVKAMLAPDAKNTEPFVDPDLGGSPLPLPTTIEARIAGWRRAKDLQGGEDDTRPYVLEPTIDPEQPRVLANGLSLESSAPLFEWMLSCILFIAARADQIGEHNYLWQLIYPQSEPGVPSLSERGRYVVRLFDHGAWRAVVIDDTVPVDEQGVCLFPRSNAPRELWPFLLTKAVLKLSSRTSLGLGVRDPTVVSWLTGWLPQTLPIDPLAQPVHLVWGEIDAALARPGTIVAIAARADPDDAHQLEALHAAGVREGPLLHVEETRLTAAGHFVRLDSQLVTWRGDYNDTDELHWSRALDDELGWKRRQRLRKMAAGAILTDFWTDDRTLSGTFAELYVWRDPSSFKSSKTFSGITFVPGQCEALLSLKADDPTLLVGLTVSPASGLAAAPCWARLERFDYDDARADPESAHVDASRAASLLLGARAGAYRLAVHSTTEHSPHPSFFHFTLHVCGSVPLALGEGSAVALEHGARRTARLDGERAVYSAVEGGAWAVPIRAKLVLKGKSADASVSDASGRVPLTLCLTPHAEAAAQHLRLHFVDNDSLEEVTAPTLAPSGLRALPGSSAGYTVVVDCKPPVELPRANYTLDVRCPCDAELQLEAVQPSVDVLGRYEPSYSDTVGGRHVLFRYQVTGSARSHGMLRVQLSDPSAEISIEVFRLEKPKMTSSQQQQVQADLGPPPDNYRTLKSKSAVGVCVLAAVPVEPDGAAKANAPSTRVIVEATVSRQTIERLGLLRPPRGAPPDPTRPLDAVPKPPLGFDPLAGASAAVLDASASAEGGERLLARKPLTYKLSVISDVQVTVAPDEERARSLETMKSSWEAKDAGRRARGRASRSAFLVRAGVLSEEEAAAMQAAAPKGEGGGGGGGVKSKAGADGGAKDKDKAGRNATNRQSQNVGAAPGSKPGSRAATPHVDQDTVVNRTTLWREPKLRAFDATAGPKPGAGGPPGSAQVLTEEQRMAAKAEMRARLEELARQNEARFAARAGFPAARAQLVERNAQGFVSWRAEAAAQRQSFQQSWEKLRTARKGARPEEDEVVAAPTKGKSKKGK